MRTSAKCFWKKGFLKCFHKRSRRKVNCQKIVFQSLGSARYVCRVHIVVNKQCTYRLLWHEQIKEKNNKSITYWKVEPETSACPCQTVTPGTWTQIAVQVRTADWRRSSSSRGRRARQRDTAWPIRMRITFKTYSEASATKFSSKLMSKFCSNRNAL